MKVTLLIQPDWKQLVFTPETVEEKQIFKMFPIDKSVPFLIKRGSFFEKCQGGWQREYSDDDSIMFIVTEEKK